VIALWTAAGAAGVVGVFMTYSVLTGRGRRGVLTGAGALIGIALIGVSGALGFVGANLRTWDRLTHEQYVAQITFEQTGPRAFNATVTQPNKDDLVFALAGDDWQLDARVLKLPPWVNVAGLDAFYHLDRIAGRYQDIAREVSDPRTVYAISPNPGLDLWRLARSRGEALNIDASFGSAIYHPMADGARYEVRMTQTSLISRPLNATAQNAVRSWDGRDRDERNSEARASDDAN